MRELTAAFAFLFAAALIFLCAEAVAIAVDERETMFFTVPLPFSAFRLSPRGERPSNLIVPDDLTIDSLGNVYVGQAANRGVSVFEIVHQDTSPPQASESIPVNNEQTGQAIEEVEVDRLEFVVDQGSDTSPTDSGDSGRNIETVESHHNEVNDE
jgi:hypothetical protein